MLIEPANWGDVIVFSLQSTWTSVIGFVPLLLGALIVFVLGWIIALALGQLVEQVVRALKIDNLLMKLEVEKVLERGGVKLNAGAFVGGLVKWFFMVVFLLAAVNILGLNDVSGFLKDVLLYIPNVVIAAVILIIAALVAETTEKLVRGSIEAAGHRGSLAGVAARWSIWIFALIAALLQLRIVPELIQAVVSALVYGIALAFGIAFGLGGKDAAADMIAKVRGEIRR